MKDYTATPLRSYSRTEAEGLDSIPTAVLEVLADMVLEAKPLQYV